MYHFNGKPSLKVVASEVNEWTSRMNQSWRCSHRSFDLQIQFLQKVY